MRLWAGMLAMVAAGVPPLLAAQAKPPASPVTAPAPATPATPASPKSIVVERVTMDELKKLMEAGKVLVVDVRSAEAYQDGHIPGSVSAPLSEIDTHLLELKSAKKAIVTYCT